MENQQHHFSSACGETIFYQCWLPDGTPRAILLLVHGLAEHSGRYRDLAAAFTERGYAIYAPDLVGHGKSTGSRGHIEHFAWHLDVVQELLALVQLQNPGRKRFLVGHSMGGLVSANLVLRDQHAFDGMILSGPAVMSPLQPGAIQMLLIRLLSVLAPRLGVLQLDAEGVSRDPEVVRNYREDPLNHTGKVSARTVRELFAYMSALQSRAGEISLPALLLHGEADSMAAAEGSRFLDENISSEDKTLHIYPGLYHEIFNEPEREDIFNEVLGWLDQRTAVA